MSALHFESFTYAWIYNILHWLFGKFGELSYIELPYVETFYYIIFKNIRYINITFSLIRKLFKCWDSVKFHCGRCEFYKILIFALKLEFYPWQHSQLFFLTGSLCSFPRKMFAKHLCLHSVFCKLISQIKIIFHKTQII